jgi:hypothetical protein
MQCKDFVVEVFYLPVILPERSCLKVKLSWL